jgi:hypothetical protein
MNSVFSSAVRQFKFSKYRTIILPEVLYDCETGTLYPRKLVVMSPTSGGRSVGIVRSRTEATEFSLVIFACKMLLSNVTVLQTLVYVLIADSSLMKIE